MGMGFKKMSKGVSSFAPACQLNRRTVGGGGAHAHSPLQAKYLHSESSAFQQPKSEGGREGALAAARCAQDSVSTQMQNLGPALPSFSRLLAKLPPFGTRCLRLLSPPRPSRQKDVAPHSPSQQR